MADSETIHGDRITDPARSVVVLLHLEGVVASMPAFLIPSAVIGLLVGGIAGAAGKPLRGAAIGAILSGVMFELFMLPCVSMIGLFSPEAGKEFLGGTLPYALQMALAGAIAGGAGGGVACLQPRMRNREVDARLPAGEDSASRGD